MKFGKQADNVKEIAAIVFYFVAICVVSIPLCGLVVIGVLELIMWYFDLSVEDLQAVDCIRISYESAGGPEKK